MTTMNIQLNEKVFNRKGVVLCTNCGYQLEDFEIAITERDRLLLSLVDDHKIVSINPIQCPKCKVKFMDKTKKSITNLQIFKAPSRAI